MTKTLYFSEEAVQHLCDEQCFNLIEEEDGSTMLDSLNAKFENVLCEHLKLLEQGQRLSQGDALWAYLHKAGKMWSLNQNDDRRKIRYNNPLSIETQTIIRSLSKKYDLSFVEMVNVLLLDKIIQL